MKRIIFVLGGVVIVIMLGTLCFAYFLNKANVAHEAQISDDSLEVSTKHPTFAQDEMQQPQAQVVDSSKTDTPTKVVDTYPTIGVVSASLTAAEKMSTDSNIKRLISDARSSAELYYDSNGNSYQGVCASANGVLNAKTELAKISVSVVCKESISAWAMSAELVGDPSQYQCVDFPNGILVRNSQIILTSCM